MKNLHQITALLLLFSTTTVALDNVTCVFDLISQDSATEGVEEEYGECTRTDGTVIHLPFAGEISDFATGDTLKIEITPLAMTTPEHPWQWATPPESSFSILRLINHEVAHQELVTMDVEFNQPAGSDQGRSEPYLPHSLLSVRCDLADSSPTYCDEDCVHGGMWGVARYIETAVYVDVSKHTFIGNLSDLYSRASYGKLQFPEALGKVITVQLETSSADYSKRESDRCCRFNEFETDCRAAAVEQFPLLDVDRFTHLEFFMPLEVSGCGFLGVANIGCAPPSHQQPTKQCHISMRTGSASFRGHEMGHNLGLHDSPRHLANEQLVKYGDQSTLMGNAHWFRYYNAAQAYVLGFIEAERVPSSAWESQPVVNLNLVDLALDPRSFAPLRGFGGVRADRDVATALFISFRAGEHGYDSEMKEQYRQKVYIHSLGLGCSHLQPNLDCSYDQNWRCPSCGGGKASKKGSTVLLASLSLGGRFIDTVSNLLVEVCSMCRQWDLNPRGSNHTRLKPTTYAALSCTLPTQLV